MTPQRCRGRRCNLDPADAHYMIKSTQQSDGDTHKKKAGCILEGKGLLVGVLSAGECHSNDGEHALMPCQSDYSCLSRILFSDF